MASQGIFMKHAQDFLVFLERYQDSLHFDPFIVAVEFSCLHEYLVAMNEAISR